MKSHGDIIEGLYPGYFDQGGAERYAAQGVTPAHALSMAMQYEGKVKMTAAAKANVAADIANGKEDVTKQTNVYSNVAMNAVATGLQAFVNTAGGDKNLHALWQSITSGSNPPTPEQITQIDQALAGVQMNVQSQLIKEKADRKTYANMTASDFDKEDKAALEPINTIRTLIHNQEYGLATAAIRANTMTEANTTSVLLANSQIAKAAALNKMSGALGQTAAISAASDVAAVMLPGFSVGVFNGTVGFGDIAKTLNTDKTLNPKTASEVASTLVKSTAEAIATGKATDQNVKDFVAKQMGPGGGMFAFFSGLKGDSDRYQVWNTYANPAIATRIAKLNDPDTTSAYGKWMVQSFENLGDIRGIAGRVAQANQSNGRNASQFVYNPKTSQFDVSPPIGADGKGLPPDSRQTEIETQANAIQPLNAGLKQVATFMKSVGIDPNDPARGIPKVLSDLRVGDPTGDQNSAAPAAPSPIRKQSEYPPDQPGVKYAKVPGSSYAPDNSGKSSASSAIDDATQVLSARDYLNSLSMHGFRMGDTSNLSPTFAVRMADAIHEAREAGLNVGVMSAFRTGDTTGSRYDAEGFSLHDKGGAIDVSGLDGPNGPATKQWAEIAAKHGIHNPYGVGNEREFNHWQMIPDKLEDRPDLVAKFEAAGDQPSKWKVLENEAKVHDNLNQDQMQDQQIPLDKRAKDVAPVIPDTKPSWFGRLLGYTEGPNKAPDDQHYPNDVDAKIAQQVKQTYGDAVATFLQPGSLTRHMSVPNLLTAFNDTGTFETASRIASTPEERDNILKNWLGAQKSPVSALGFDPNHTVTSLQKTDLNVAGIYMPKSDTMWYDTASQDSVVHESIHRGIEILRKSGDLPKSVEETMDNHGGEEYMVRALKVKYFGDIEAPIGKTSAQQVERAKQLMTEYPDFKQAMDDLENAAAKHLAMQHPKGPR